MDKNQMNDKLKDLSKDDQNTTKFLISFLELVLELTPAEFCGTARILQVDLYRPTTEVEAEATKLNIFEEEARKTYLRDNCARDFEDILSDMLDKFASLNRTRRRNLMKILKQAK